MMMMMMMRLTSSVLSSDRCRTTNNMLGDCYAAAVVEALSSKELSAMDAVTNKKGKLEKIVVESPETEALIGPKVTSPSECSNGSRNMIDEVRSSDCNIDLTEVSLQVVTIETSTDEEDSEDKSKSSDIV